MSALFTKITSGDSAGPADRDTSRGRGDFDFLHGAWRVDHRRLRHRLVGDTEWLSFQGLCDCRPVIGGLGNIDDNLLELPAGTYRAASLRLFDPAQGVWTIWWVDGRLSRLDPPVRGRFEDGVGHFFGDDSHDGRPIRIQFIWSDITGDSAQWQQAYSEDGGATWETNWIMRLTRIA